MSRLSIEIEPEQHRQIKMLATFAGLSIKDYILQKSLAPEKVREELDGTDVLLSSDANSRRLKAALESKGPDNRVFDNLEDLRNALGIS